MHNTSTQFADGGEFGDGSRDWDFNIKRCVRVDRLVWHNLQALSTKYQELVKFVHNLRMSKKNFIGILGGTFDPPHKGHLFISNYAMKRLDLGEVWWIVTKKNPLKFGSGNFKKDLKVSKVFY